MNCSLTSVRLGSVLFKIFQKVLAKTKYRIRKFAGFDRLFLNINRKMKKMLQQFFVLTEPASEHLQCSLGEAMPLYSEGSMNQTHHLCSFQPIPTNLIIYVKLCLSWMSIC